MKEKERSYFLNEFIFALGIEGWIGSVLIKRKKETVLQAQESM